ncbi:PHB depolymerase family esterase [Caulobacter sp. 17J80-11]|uniref:extracellular catalytic domain type 1 short-chain-length polyhydroxyalkanoate depolymerase n=1 Tax=Caulobacter sp. 17J80-11 TaxID=2763502 RepID=UPI001653D531|nr:PHB depolymerase family esterase [Caulobacter sp. 17J80-11]MBC6981711.1 PHB depolymerase family esterase [Caulobacter sp. 17J80-11]
MPSLGESTELLARLRRRAQNGPATPYAGETRLKETLDFGDNPGALRMLTYVPEGLAPSAPLVVVLHGCTQRAEAHAHAAGWLTLADRCGFAVVAPEQTQANNPNRCFNWFQPEDATRGRGEAASIRAMVAHAIRTHGLDSRRVFVTGLSAGGAMTSVMLATYPEVFAAGAVVAGLPYGVAANVQEALAAMHGGRAHAAADLGARVRRAAPAGSPLPRLSVWHGSADTTVKPRAATDTARQWAAAHGLASEPDETHALSGRTRAVWRGPGSDEVLIELNLIQGLGHGTPLATGAPEGVGAAGAFMLEAGVSSSREIARFWDLPETASPVAASEAATPRPALADAPELGRRHPVPASLGDQVMAALEKHVPGDVQGVIASALRTARLM